MTQDDVLYDVYFTGKLLDNITAEQAGQSVAKLFNTSPEKIKHLFNGKTHILKKGLTKPNALKYKSALRKAGLSILFKVSEATPTASAPKAPSSDDKTSELRSQQQTSEAPAASGSMTIAPAGADILNDAERTSFVPANIDTSAIKLSSPFIEPEVVTKPTPQAPDTSHINIAEVGAQLSDNANTVTPELNLNLDDITLAPPGADLEQLKEDLAEINPDTSAISIAPVGADIIEDKQEAPPVPTPDISHISLED